MINGSNYTYPSTKPKVALVRCESYAETELEQTVARGLNLLGGADTFFNPGETLLLKPNILIGENPKKHVTTHPAVFNAVAKALQEAGAQLTYGDSPAFGPPQVSTALSGLAAVADALNIPLADFVHGQLVSFPQGNLIKQFTIARGVLAADGIISISKFKTHALTRLTGAVKNLFGCIPGLLKSQFHATLNDELQFGKMLLDLNSLLRPRLCVMDAIMGMEGNGPRNGTVRKVSLLIFANDPSAMDAVAARLMALDPLLVPTLAAAEEWQAGTAENYKLLGDPIEAFIMKDYKVNRSSASTTKAKGMFAKLFKDISSPRPVINQEKCTACGTCVDICPVTPKALSFRGDEGNLPPIYDYDLCIRCYCCQETCPYDAITVKTPFLGRILQ
ncbi:MAG: DUF362 domain-containing protein [Chloroflexota bacterium]